jgi:hypothetical protein
MKKIVLIITSLNLYAHLFSQDSIRFMNHSIIAAKISEVGITDIKYHRFDNLDGPQYIVNKLDIQYIRFANGTVDSIHTEVAKSTTEPKFAYKNEIVNSSTTYNTDAPKIIIKRNRLVYNNRGLGETKLWMLIDNFPNKEGKVKLMTEFNAMKKYKTKQYTAGFVGLGLALLSPFVGGLVASEDAKTHPGSSYDRNRFNIVVGGFGTGIALGVIGSTMSTVFKAKRIKKRTEIAGMYNDMR